MKVFGFALVLLSVAMVGCNILPERVEQLVHYYDIGDPSNKTKLKIRLKLTSVNSVFSEKTQMVFKNGLNAVLIDEYNRWSDLPTALLRRYLVLLLSDSAGLKGNVDSADNQFALNVEIVRFDCDLKNGTSNVAALFAVVNSRTSKIVWRHLISGEGKARSDTAGGYAAAMSNAVSDMMSRMLLKLNAADLRAGSKK